MGAGVEMLVETGQLGSVGSTPGLEIRLLGPLAVRRADGAVDLPPSRKVRALLAYLSLAPRPLTRNHLCELLWDVPDDPRGELRWCLTKIRRVLDEPGRRRVEARADTISLDLEDCAMDAAEVTRAAQTGFEALAPARLANLAGLFAGDFLEGLEIERSPVFSGWLVAQRRHFRDCHAALSERLATLAPDNEVLGHLQRWLQVAPFDKRPHNALLTALARRGRIREGEEHLAATARLFASEDLDSSSLHEAWRTARAQADTTRFDGAVRPVATAISSPQQSATHETPPTEARRSSVAVMPFLDPTAGALVPGGTADGLVHDVIARLAGLRCLFVIAQGTVFALRERCVPSDQAAHMLGVDYAVNGSLQRRGNRLAVTVDLTEVRSGRIVWTEVFEQKAGDAFLIADDIGDRMVASIAAQIEVAERNRAMLKPPGSLDAWGAYHRGLWHMYRFNRPDNVRAQRFFELATGLDPTFSRAYAGLSFTHWQSAFQGWAEREGEVERAYAAAGQSLMVDDRDPAAHWAMGRALWLKGHHQQSVGELEQSVELSPNFALGHYTLAFVHSLTGDPAAAVAASDQSRRLSPFDPMLFGILGARAMGLAHLGRFEEAANSGVQAAARPNAHVHISALAALFLALADRRDEARAYLGNIRRTQPDYGLAHFLAAMRPAPDREALFQQAWQRIGQS